MCADLFQQSYLCSNISFLLRNISKSIPLNRLMHVCALNPSSEKPVLFVLLHLITENLYRRVLTLSAFYRIPKSVLGHCSFISNHYVSNEIISSPPKLW